MRDMQNYHQDTAGKKDWVDITYNFVVGGDGVVYEGRGWDLEGTHTKDWNKNTTGLAIIGNFTAEAELPTQEQTDMLVKLIQWGVEDGKIVKDGYRLAGACQLSVSDVSSPGKGFMPILESLQGWWNFNWKACYR